MRQSYLHKIERSVTGELSGNNNGNDGVEALSDALKTNATVKEFYIGRQNMQDVFFLQKSGL